MWGAISYEGPVALECMEEKLNSQAYLKLLKKTLSKVEGLVNGKLHFQHDNWNVHTAKIVQEYLEE